MRPGVIEPTEYRGVVFALEPMRDTLEEIKPLHQAHWDELAELRPEGEFKPDYDRFMRLESVGSAILVAARARGELIGYCQYYMNNHPYTQERYASSDVVYLKREFRDGWVGVALFNYAHKVLKWCGVRRVRAFCREGNRVRALLDHYGYEDTRQKLYEVTL